MSKPAKGNLRQRLDAIARTDRGSGPVPYTTSQRQTEILMDRLLDHLEITDPANWRVHGSVAIMSRGVVGARAPKDLDLRSLGSHSAPEAIERLRTHLALEGHLPIEFELINERHTQNSVRAEAKVSVEGRFWLTLGLDVRSPTGGPAGLEPIEPMVDVTSLGLLKVVHHGLPLAGQIAEKANGMLIPDIRYRERGLSSRFKDVYDLLVLTRTFQVDAASVRDDFRLAAAQVDADLPPAFVGPSSDPSRSGEIREWWVKGVTRVLEANGMRNVTCEEAEREVGEFLGPVLDGSAIGYWSPVERSWGHELVRTPSPHYGADVKLGIETGEGRNILGR